MARNWFGFGRISVFFYISWVFTKAVRAPSPCFAYTDLLTQHAGYAIMTLTEMHVRWSVIFADRLGPEILTMLEINGQVL